MKISWIAFAAVAALLLPAHGNLAHAQSSDSDLRCYGMAIRRVLDRRRDPPIVNVTLSDLKRDYLHKDATSVEERRRFIELKNKTGPDDGSVFVHFDNAKFKDLNDHIVKDFDAVTAIEHRYQEIVFDRLKGLEKSNPGLKIERYSDSKSGDIAFSGKIPDDLPARIQRIFDESDREFSAQIESLLSLNRSTDVMPDMWHFYGMGSTADESNVVSRMQRQMSGPKKVRAFGDPEVQGKIDDVFKYNKMYRDELEKDLAGKGLLSPPDASGKLLPKQDVYDVLRKSDDPKVVSETLRAKKIGNIDEATASKLIEHYRLLNEFSPSLFTEQRVVVTLNDASYGAIALDRKSMGAMNARQTASDLARASDVQDAVVQARSGEQVVTDLFRRENEKLTEIGRRHGFAVRCGGDDCNAIATRPMTSEMRDGFLRDVANEMGAGNYRASSIRPGVKKPGDRTLLGNHGHQIEKKMPGEILKVLDPDKAKKLMLVVQMDSLAVGRGTVRLLVNADASIQLSRSEIQAIQQVFADTVTRFNTATNGVTYSYTSSVQVRLIR